MKRQDKLMQKIQQKLESIQPVNTEKIKPIKEDGYFVVIIDGTTFRNRNKKKLFDDVNLVLALRKVRNK